MSSSSSSSSSHLLNNEDKLTASTSRKEDFIKMKASIILEEKVFFLGLTLSTLTEAPIAKNKHLLFWIVFTLLLSILFTIAFSSFLINRFYANNRKSKWWMWYLTGVYIIRTLYMFELWTITIVGKLIIQDIIEVEMYSGWHIVHVIFGIFFIFAIYNYTNEHYNEEIDLFAPDNDNNFADIPQLI